MLHSTLNKKAPNRRVTFDVPLSDDDHSDSLHLPPVIPPPPVPVTSDATPPTSTGINNSADDTHPAVLSSHAPLHDNSASLPGPSSVFPVPPSNNAHHGKPRRKLHLTYGSSPIPVNQTLDPPPFCKRNAHDCSKKQQKAKRSTYLPPRVTAVPSAVVSTRNGGVTDPDQDDSDDDEDGSSEDDDPGPAHCVLSDATMAPRRSNRTSKPKTFFGSHSNSSPSPNPSDAPPYAATSDPPPDPTLTCSLATITDAVDSSTHLFSTHEVPTPRKPNLTDAPVSTFGKILDLNLDGLSNMIAQQITYLVQLDHLNTDASDDDADAKTWRCIRIQKHRVYKNKTKRLVFVKAEWASGSTSWVQLQAMLLHDPFVLIQYAYDHFLLKQSNWKWVSPMVADTEKFHKVFRANTAAVCTAPRFKFGLELPRGLAHAF